MSAQTFRVRYEHPKTGERSDAVARELSLGGMFVATASPIEEGALLAIEIDLGGKNVSVDARVLRTEPDGMRLVFLDLPEDVAATLSAAVTPASQRTVLGVGGATMTSTTPGLATPAEARTPKAVPSVNTTTPGIAAPAEARPEPKAKPKTAAEETRRESSAPPPPPKSGGAGKWFFLLLLAGGAAAAYVYRDPLRREIEKAIGPEPSPAPTPAASVQPTPIVEAGVDAAPDAQADAEAVDAAVADAATEAGARDAGAEGGIDGGARDAGARDGGHPDAGHRDAGVKK